MELVATEGSGCRYCHWGQKLLRKVHGQQVLTWILERLSRREPFKVPGGMILGAGKVQGDCFAERGRSEACSNHNCLLLLGEMDTGLDVQLF